MGFLLIEKRELMLRRFWDILIGVKLVFNSAQGKKPLGLELENVERFCPN